ncbi:MAG: hypothetical protein Q9M13_07655, partial [Mariprofundales bacterium]|nr:hypothetical protein [Mariprofundales bacterium]
MQSGYGRGLCNRIVVTLLGTLLIAGCSHRAPDSYTKGVYTTKEGKADTIGPYAEPEGRVIILGRYRAQLLFSCRRVASGGLCRFTHGASGQIIELRWHSKMVWQRRNSRNHHQWQRITTDELHRLGMVVDPTTMMEIGR